MMIKWHPGKPLELDCSRFRLYPLSVDDIDEDYVGWWNDPEIRYGLGAPDKTWDQARARQFVAGFNHSNAIIQFR